MNPFSWMTSIIGFVMATALFWAGIAVEHRPAGWPNLALHWGIFNWELHLPNGPEAKYALLEAQIKAAGQHSVRIEVAQNTITQKAAPVEAAAQAKIQFIYKTIHDEVPTYVTPQIDRTYPLSNQFVRVLDAGALGLDLSKISLPAGQSDDSTSPVTSSIVASNQIDDDKICYETSERLSGLQAWIRAEAQASLAP